MSNEMTVSFPGGKRVTASYHGFEIATDQHPSSGGEGSAPEPYDLFLASLATCAGIYVLGFCERRGIPYEGVRLVQRWHRQPDHRMARIELEIRVPAGFPEKYHRAIERAAAQCSVKRTMQDPPEFDVRTVVDDGSPDEWPPSFGSSLPVR